MHVAMCLQQKTQSQSNASWNQSGRRNEYSGTQEFQEFLRIPDKALPLTLRYRSTAGYGFPPEFLCLRLRRALNVNTKILNLIQNSAGKQYAEEGFV